MLVDSLKKFSEEANGKLIFDYDLKKTNWFNIGGKTKAYFKPDSLNELISFLKNSTAPIQTTLADTIKGHIGEGVALMTFLGHASATGGFDQNIDDVK